MGFNNTIPPNRPEIPPGTAFFERKIPLSSTEFTPYATKNVKKILNDLSLETSQSLKWLATAKK